MKTERFEKYYRAESIHKKRQLAWPLYGAGLENLGIDGKPVEREIPSYSDDELLMRIDAVSLCYTDVKEIDAGDAHPRLTERNLKVNPIVPGHEISFTVMGVGKNLVNEYRIGQRFTLQPDVWVEGKSVPFCFGMDGGYRQYAAIGREILHGDAGNYLIPVPDDMPYASSAITEPWACVEAAYRMPYRDTFKKDGLVLFWGGESTRLGYTIDQKWFSANAPKQVVITDVPEDLRNNLVALCERSMISWETIDRKSLLASDRMFDDIVLLDADPQVFNQASRMLANSGVLALMSATPLNGTVEIDLGRLHYDSIYFVGSETTKIELAYQQTEPRVSLKPGGVAWILGAGGPMGRLHLQRAIESKNGPSLIVASEVTESRYDALIDFFAPFARKNNKELVIVNSVADPQGYQAVMDRVQKMGGFDDIQVMVAIPKIIVESTMHAGKGAVIDLFAGLKRGELGLVDAWLISGPKQIRMVGHSGSGLDDQKAVVDRVISGQLKPELSVAAVGGLNQIPDGIKAMKNWVFPGKIVIFPHVTDFPLTAISDLDKRIPEIAEFLGEGKTWTAEAEKIFLDRVLDHD